MKDGMWPTKPKILTIWFPKKHADTWPTTHRMVREDRTFLPVARAESILEEDKNALACLGRS